MSALISPGQGPFGDRAGSDRGAVTEGRCRFFLGFDTFAKGATAKPGEVLFKSSEALSNIIAITPFLRQ
jgi:hypothetical protein